MKNKRKMILLILIIIFILSIGSTAFAAREISRLDGTIYGSSWTYANKWTYKWHDSSEDAVMFLESLSGPVIVRGEYVNTAYENCVTTQTFTGRARKLAPWLDGHGEIGYRYLARLKLDIGSAANVTSSFSPDET